MSVGSGNLVGCLRLSVNPSTDIAAAITLDLRMITVCQDSMFIRVWLEHSKHPHIRN